MSIVIHVSIFTRCVSSEYGTDALSEEKTEVYSDLAKVLEMDFTGGNSVLTELYELYTSCIAAEQMDNADFAADILPVIRKQYEEFGMSSRFGTTGIS